MENYKAILEKLSSGGNLREIPGHTADLCMVDLSTNDYLGLGTSAELRKEFLEGLGAEIPPLTSSASRLLASSQREYDELEALLAGAYGRDVLLFNSGYHANVGAISSLADERTLIVADKLVHASIIDGATLSRGKMERFRHNDVNHLESILKHKAGEYHRVIIVTESVFSMDGDVAPLADIVKVKRNYANSLLYVDEAHAFGVLGSQGLGLCADMDDVDFIVGTLGKAAASVGAFIATNALGRRYLLNKARSFIFSTAIPPFNCAWSKFLIERIFGMDDERQRLKELGMLLQKVTGATHSGHIQPLITGSAETAVALSRHLREEGFKVLPIRTPTVPPGTERLRFSLSLDIKEQDLLRLAEVI